MSADYVVDQKVRWSFVDAVTEPLTRVKQMITDANNLVNGSVNPTKALEDAYKTLGNNGADAIQKVATDTKKLQDSLTAVPKDTKLDVTANVNQAITDAKSVSANLKDIPKDVNTKVTADATKAKETVKEQVSLLGKIPKNVSTEILAQANEAGIKNFSDVLNKLPRSVKTELTATVNSGNVIDFQNILEKIPKSKRTVLHVDDEVSAPLHSLKTATEETQKKTSSLKDVLTGTFAGSIISNGVMAIGSKLVDSAKDGLELAEAGEQTTRAWSAMGVPQDQIKGLSSNMVELRNESGFAAGDIKNIQKQFYGFTDSAGLTEGLTKGVTALAVASGKGVETAEGLTGSFKRIESQGKLTSMAFTRMTAEAPALPKQLAAALDMSQDQLKKAVADGNVSADQFTQAISKIGANSKQTFDDFGKTGEGVMAQIKGGWTGVKSALMQPLVDTKTSGLESVRDLLQSKDMTALAHSVGEGLSYMAEQASKVVGYIAGHQKDINNILDDLSQIAVILAKSIWSTITGVVKDIANSFGLVSDSAKKSHDPLKQVESVLGEVLKHKEAIQDFGRILVAAFAVKQIFSFVTGLGSAIKSIKDTAGAFKELNAVIAANKFAIIVTAIIAIVAAFVELYKHNAKFRSFVDGIVESIKQFYKDATKWLGDAIAWVRKTFGPFFTDALKTVQAFWKEIEPIVTVGIKVLSSAIKLGIDLIADIWKIGWGLLSTYLKAVWAVIHPIIDVGMAVIKSTITLALHVIQGSWQAVWNALVSILRMAWDIMKPLTLGALNGIADIIKLVSGPRIKSVQVK